LLVAVEQVVVFLLDLVRAVVVGVVVQQSEHILRHHYQAHNLLLLEVLAAHHLLEALPLLFLLQVVVAVGQELVQARNLRQVELVG
jgi:hypothetical protein